MTNAILSRKDLYDLVWSKPIIAISKELKIGESALRKICSKYNIPLPKNGYWMKKQYGKPIEVEEFPIEFIGSDDISFTEEFSKTIILTEDLSPLKILIKEIENDPKVKLKVPAVLKDPIDIIKLTQIELNRKDRYSRDYNQSREYIHMDVSKENIARSLIFMDTFIKCIKQRGHKFIHEGWNSYIIICGQKINVRIRESYKRVLVKGGFLDRTDKIMNGILCFHGTISYTEVCCKDGKEKIEEQLSKIIAKLEILGKSKYDEEVEWAKRRELERIEKNIRLDKQRIILAELKQFKMLISDAKKHSEVIMLRNYIAAVKEKVKLTGAQSNKASNDWIEWAEKKVDWYDPLINLSDTNFADIDKEKLELLHQINDYGY